MIRVLSRPRTTLLGGAALTLLATAMAPAASAAPAQRDAPDETAYVIRHAPSSDRLVPSSWSKDPTTVVSYGYNAPAGEDETWELSDAGQIDVGYQNRAVYQIRYVNSNNQCLEANGNGIHAYIYQRTCEANDPAQEWVLIPSPTTDDAYRIAPVRNPSIAVTPQNPTSHWSYLWLAEPTRNADWYFDLPAS